MMNSQLSNHAGAGTSYTDLSSLQAIKTLSLEDKNQALDEVSTQFESIMVQMMLKSMRAANDALRDKEGVFSSNEVQFYQNMLDDQLSLTLSEDGGVGIADAMVRQLQQRFGNDSSENTLKSESEFFVRPEGNLSKVNPQVKPVKITAVEFDGSVEGFVAQLLPMAEKAAARLGVDPQALIAQAALETGWGAKVTSSANGQSSNNLFNIKADSRWQGEAVSVPTLEYREGIPVREFAQFRAYSSPEQSFDDYVNFISTSYRYEDAVRAGNTEAYVRKLSDAGYATDPAYAEKVLRILNSDSLKSAVNNSKLNSAEG